ncbi:hypothetical protein HPB49_018745 [Dermacentor silvarum]|uniref:Uncharacterized protein n=1 Tax=Dermacentor silvarum TaxID=543639 RepID=A0ACB8DFF2_DERSI|nr:hypothetical protein HPB49_018745 [Dermacentor silvarum]
MALATFAFSVAFSLPVHRLRAGYVARTRASSVSPIKFSAPSTSMDDLEVTEVAKASFSRDGLANNSPSPTGEAECRLFTPKPGHLSKARVLKAGRMPPLPSNEIKVIIRPKGALNIAKIGSPTVTTTVFQAPQLSPADIQQDTVCPTTQQNIVVVSTPSPPNADTAAEDTTKGVIRGIPLSDTQQQINANIVNTCNPLALAAKRIGTTTTVVTAFSGPDLPYLVRYGATLIPCSLYRKQEICYKRGRLGHRMDVCPSPNNKICRGCGVRNPPPDHTCNPKCSQQIVHTAPCKTLYVVRKRIGERRAAMQVTLQKSDFPPMNYKHRSKSRSPSRSRQHYSPTPSLWAPRERAPKKRALQEGAAGQVRSEFKDMLVSLRSPMETLQNAVESVQHGLLVLAQRVTNVENHLQTLPMPGPAAHETPALPMMAYPNGHHGPP